MNQISPFALIAAQDLLLAASEAIESASHEAFCDSHREHACSCWIGKLSRAIDKAKGARSVRCPVCRDNECQEMRGAP